uniref:Uncharacterized protein n=1 Tax=Anguilla anguilla TaxID=7936 RepID=A0A0E9XJA5_ANGAN
MNYNICDLHLHDVIVVRVHYWCKYIYFSDYRTVLVLSAALLMHVGLFPAFLCRVENRMILRSIMMNSQTRTVRINELWK